MLTEKSYQTMSKAIKTGAIKKELAKEEIKNNVIFTDIELQRVIIECNINIISRKDIDFQKLLIKDVKYQAAQKKVMEFIDFLKITENQTDENKEKALKLIEDRDNIYDELEEEFL